MKKKIFTKNIGNKDEMKRFAEEVDKLFSHYDNLNFEFRNKIGEVDRLCIAEITRSPMGWNLKRRVGDCEMDDREGTIEQVSKWTQVTLEMESMVSVNIKCI